MMRLLAVLLVACGTGRSPGPRTELEVSSDAGPGSAAPTSVTGTRRERIEAPHGAPIAHLAATPDGKSAVSVDELGGARLWPALDGSIEPRVIDLAQPEELAILARDTGFAIAAIDSAGGLAVTQVDRDGITQQRVGFPVEPGFVGVLATERAFLAWRVDQRVVMVGADGAVVHELAAEPGQRIAGLATAGGRAVAAIESAQPARRARWVTLGSKLAWGAWIPIADVGKRLALSPSGKRLGYLMPNHQLRVFDLERGIHVDGDRVAAGLALGLPDDKHVVLAHPGGTVFWLADADDAKKIPRGFAPSDQPPPLAIGGGWAIAVHHNELVLASPARTRYLGYQLASPSVVSGAPSGGLLLGLGSTFAQLDATLTASRTPPDLMIPDGSSVSDLRWLGGDEWLVESSRTNDGVSAIALVDTTRKASTEVRGGMPMVQMLMHEPTTKLVTLSLGDQPEVLRHEPGRQRLVKVAALPRPVGFERAEIFPVVPKRAGGVHLVVVHMRERLVIRWVADPRALERGTTLTVDGSLANVDGAGHVFVWQSIDGGLELVVLANGKRIGTLASDGPTSLFPDRDGARVLQIGQRSLRLVTLDGATVWTQPIHGVDEALWLDDGGLAIVSAAGIARLDPATGELVAARCGWQFGLADKPHPGAPRLEPLCTQLR